MCDLVTDQRARVGRTIVGNRQSTVGRYDVHIKVHQPLTADGAAGRSYTVRCMARRATDARVDVIGMIRPTRVLYDLVGQIVALGA